jgi:hypothetical protein
LFVSARSRDWPTLIIIIITIAAAAAATTTTTTTTTTTGFADDREHIIGREAAATSTPTRDN